MTESPIRVAKPAATDEGVLADHHRRNLARLRRIPYDPEYVTPQEVLVIVGYCFEYAVDYTQGLEPRNTPGELVRRVRVRMRTPLGVRSEAKPCRFRREVLLENTQGTLVPDGGILWAQQILGELREAASRSLRLLGAK